MAGVRDVPISALQWLFIIPSFLAVIVINLFVVYKPMKMGLASLRDYE